MTRRGFSLIELLMAIFILGIGLISIAALFPAGIALQQRAEDELNGPIVAAHALEVIRGRLSSDDFGSWWDFHNTQVDYTRWLEGDDAADVMESNTVGKLYNDRYSQPVSWLNHETWPWLRPAMVVNVTDEDLANSGAIKAGTLDIFNSLGFENKAETIGEHTLPVDHVWQQMLSYPVHDSSTQFPKIGIPFHARHIVTEDPDTGLRMRPPLISVPRVLITPEERAWPNADAMGRVPQYYWDCAFRRIGSDVQVAIFVYRAQRSSLSQPMWQPGPIIQADAPGEQFIPVPWVVDLTTVADGSFGPWKVEAVEGAVDFPGTNVENFTQDGVMNPGYGHGPDHPDFGWMWPGQWLVDQAGDVHRVANGRSISDEPDPNYPHEDETPFSLTAPIPAPLAAFQMDRAYLDDDDDNDDPQLFTASVILPASSMADMNQADDYPTGLIGAYSQTIPRRSVHPVVDRLWYVPPAVNTSTGSYRLIPIYVTVGSL